MLCYIHNLDIQIVMWWWFLKVLLSVFSGTLFSEINNFLKLKQRFIIYIKHIHLYIVYMKSTVLCMKTIFFVAKMSISFNVCILYNLYLIYLICLNVLHNLCFFQNKLGELCFPLVIFNSIWANLKCLISTQTNLSFFCENSF